MAKILLIETATNVCSAAIAIDGKIATLKETRDTLDHAALLTLHIQECAEKSDVALAGLDAVALSSGPGSYTSLRVGASVAKGICYALEKPLIAINTLEALVHCPLLTSQDLSGPYYFVPMLDARRQEVWTALFNASFKRISPDTPLVLENNLFFNFINQYLPTHSKSKFYIFGNGMEKAKKGFLHQEAAFCQVTFTSAAYMANLAENAFHKADFQNISYFEPFYMKPPNITTPAKIF